jgi:hypothetical protein
MPWGPGQSVTTGSIAANLDRLYVFGATDSGKNLVTGTSVTATLNGGAAYGSDSIGTYVGNASAFGYLNLATTSASAWPTGDYTYFLTFSRESAPAAWAGLFSWLSSPSGGREIAIQRESTNANTRFGYSSTFVLAVGYNVATITASTEYTIAVVFSGTTMKVFYKGGASPITFSGTTTVRTGTITNLTIGGWVSGEWYPGRFRAFGEWRRALSDAEAQSMADNPQQIITPAVTYTYARPTSDITTQWTPSTGTDHFALIDETTANDSDYIYATAAGQTDEVRLASMAAPTAGTNLTVKYRVQGITDGGNVTVTLVLGGAVVKTDTTRLVDGDYSMDVTPTDYAGVTDWTDVALRFVS